MSHLKTLATEQAEAKNQERYENTTKSLSLTHNGNLGAKTNQGGTVKQTKLHTHTLFPFAAAAAKKNTAEFSDKAVPGKGGE